MGVILHITILKKCWIIVWMSTRWISAIPIKKKSRVGYFEVIKFSQNVPLAIRVYCVPYFETTCDKFGEI